MLWFGGKSFEGLGRGKPYSARGEPEQYFDDEGNEISTRPARLPLNAAKFKVGLDE